MISNAVSLIRQPRLRAVALIAALVIGGSVTALGQAGSPAADPQEKIVGGVHIYGADAMKAAAANAEKAAGKDEKGVGGVHQGLKLHGHWTITIKNPDGTVTSHNEFENSLTGGGPSAILSLIAGQATPSDLMIGFSDVGGTPPCVSTQGVCGIVRILTDEPADSNCQVFYCVTGLTTTLNINSTPPTLTYAGSFTATQAGAINTVATYVGMCGFGTGNVSSSAPNVCNTASGGSNTVGQFTGASITPVSVLNGQIIQITVVFTIS
jgi:hypothetical protein